MTAKPATRRELVETTHQVFQYLMFGIAEQTKTKQSPNGLQPFVDYVPRGTNAPRVWALKLNQMNPKAMPQVISACNDLGRYVGLSDRQGIRAGWIGNNLSLEIPKINMSYWQAVTVNTLAERKMLHRGRVGLALGLGVQNEPIYLSYKDAMMAHILIAGQTRSGKTNVQKLIAWNLVHNLSPEQVRLFFVDTGKQGRHFKEFAHVPHLAYPMIGDIERAEAVLTWLDQERIRRASQINTKAFWPKLFIFIDEVANLAEQSQVAQNILASLASIGGELGIYLVLATQYPQIKLLGSPALKRNLTTKLCGKVDDSNAAYNTLGTENSGAEKLGGYGDMLLKPPGQDDLCRMVAAFIGDKTLAAMEHGQTPYLIDRLPDPDAINSANGTKPPPVEQTSDPVEPSQVLLALYNDGALAQRGLMGIQKMVKLFGIGTKKAYRIQDYAREMMAWAYLMKIDGLEFSHLPDSEKQAVLQIVAKLKGSNHPLLGGE